MGGASVYGLVEYRQSQHNEQFRKLYKLPADPEAAKQPEKNLDAKKDQAASPVVTPAKEVIPMAVSDAHAPSGASTNATKVTSKNLRISYRIFSRAIPAREMDEQLKRSDSARKRQ
jgi:hypothetical protein